MRLTLVYGVHFRALPLGKSACVLLSLTNECTNSLRGARTDNVLDYEYAF